jgi:citrate lyase alpha subunit
MIIPGQSLTAEPKNAPYENPPELTTPEDAIEWHLDRLTTEDKVEALVDAMELGVDVVTLTEGILRGAVLDGRHNIDISLIIAPVVHEFIKTTADKVGIDYEEGFPDDSEERINVKYAINVRKAQKALAEYNDEEDTEEVNPEEDMSLVEDETTKDTPAAPAGLMARMSKLEGEV